MSAFSADTAAAPRTAARSASSPGTAPPAGGDQVVGERLGTRLRRWRTPVLALGALLVVALATMWMQPESSDIPYAINNPRPDGSQAVIEILRDEGVHVTTAHTLREAVDTSAPGVTVAVLNAGLLSQAQLQLLAGSGADVVVIGALYADLSDLAGLETSGTSAAPETILSPQCTDVDAQAAASLAGSRGSVSIGSAPGAVGCFPVAENRYAYATAPLASGGSLRVVADPSIVANERLTTAGNAALAIRALGYHGELVWFDASQISAPTVWNSVTTPRWLPVALLQVSIVVTALAVVKGRRFGRLVPEDLPVVVRATETTAGRGRLYRRAADRERAAQALRAGTALRLGRTLGLGTDAGRAEMVEATARASGRPPQYVDTILYGQIPRDDRSLADLAVELDRLESEVHPR